MYLSVLRSQHAEQVTQLEASGTEHDHVELGASAWYYLVHCIPGTSGYIRLTICECGLLIVPATYHSKGPPSCKVVAAFLESGYI